MIEKRQVSMYWLLKATFWLAFFVFWTAKCDAQLGTPPIIAVQPVGCSVSKGGTITLSATACSLTPMNFSWNLNGHHLPNSLVTNVVVPLVGTVTTLTISNASAANNGSYCMTVTNAVGSASSVDVSITVIGTITPLALNVLSNSPASGFSFQVSGPAGSNFVVEASSDLSNWLPLYTNKAPPPAGTISYTDSSATNYPARFYRAHLQ